MYYNEYNLEQLLDLALRVPEVGAVNFNILYYILKSIIQKQGLENVKPVFSFEAPLSVQSAGTKSKLKDVLNRSYSAESLKAINANELKRTVKDATKSDETFEARPRQSLENESSKWHAIKIFKRVDAIEVEISEIHIMVAQLVDKISNLEKTSGVQEKKYMKEVKELQHRLESNEYKQLASNLEKITSDVAELMSKVESSGAKSGEEADRDTDIDVTIPVRTSVNVSDPDIALKIDILFSDVNEIKKQLKTAPKFTESEKDAFKSDKKSDLSKKGSEKSVQEPSINRGHIAKIDLELTNTSLELQKLKEKCSAVDKMITSDLNMIKEKNLILERTVVKCKTEIDLLKAGWDEIVHNLENLRENVEFFQKEINVLTDLPGLINRIEQIEGYVFSEYDYDYEEDAKQVPSSERRAKVRLDSLSATPSDKKIPKAKKFTTSMAVTGVKSDIDVIQPIIKKMVKAKARDVEEYLGEDSDFIKGTPRKFHVTARSIALVQDMAKKKVTPKLQMDETSEEYEEGDDLDEESLYESEEKPSVEEFPKSDSLLSSEVLKESSGRKVQPSTFTSPDILEEYSRQLKGQVIVYIKMRLQAFEVDLQHIEGDLITVKKRNDLLERSLKELATKVAVAEANFSQRAGDLAAVKGMTENHEVSIVNIIHHLDRKAEAYAVNQKISRKELTVIEDRVLKLCATASSDIAKLEEKLDDSIKKFNVALDRKLFKEEFEVHFESLLHKLKLLNFRIKDVLDQNLVLDFETIRPIEIKKYVMSKDGTKVKQEKKKLTTQNFETDSLIPAQHHADKEVSPKTALQIQKELELASYRDSKRYAEGAYTKVKVGRKLALF